MTAAALLRSMVAALDQVGIPFMLTGSLAAAFHGAGRATMDIDLVIDSGTGWKADLIVRKQRAFSDTEFERRQPAVYEGCRLWVAAVEDVILSKLEWARLGGSARQLEDVRALLQANAGRLDQGYLDRWISDLGLSKEWARVQ